MAHDPLEYPEPLPLALPRPPAGRLAARGGQTISAVGGPLVQAGLRRVVKRVDAGELALSLRRAAESLGATYMKLGQIVASSPGIFGEETAATFRSCLDTGPVVPFESVKAVIERDLRRSLSTAFRDFDPDPIGRASLAVVHRAVTQDGEDVAVKVLRPGIHEVVAADLALIAPLAKTVTEQTGSEMAGGIDFVLDGLREQLGEELDLRNELRTMDHHRAVLARMDVGGVVIPASRPDLSGPNVMTMTFLDGVPVDDLSTVASLGIDPKPVIQSAIRAWFGGLLRDGTFHADLHAGNMLMLRDGRLGLIDWGIVGRLDADTHWFFRNAIKAMLGEEELWDDVVAHLERLYGPVLGESLGVTGPDLRAMLRSVFEPFFTQSFNVMSLASLMQQMPQAQGISRNGPRRSAGETLAAMRRNRRVRKLAIEQGVPEMPFNRGMMMLIKQLLYFDRYGQLFLQDSSLLEDGEFFSSVLAMPPLVVRRSAHEPRAAAGGA